MRGSAGGIDSEDAARLKSRRLRWLCGFNSKMQTRKQIGRGLRPFGSCSAATTMIVATIVAVAGLKRVFRRVEWCCSLRRLRLCHRMMAGHRGRLTLHSHLRARALPALVLGSTRHRQRPEGRDQHDQQQESSSPAVSSPHWRKAYQKISCQFSVLSFHR